MINGIERFFGNVQRKLKECQQHLDELRQEPISDESREEETLVLKEIESFLEKEEVWWSQRAKDICL